MTTYTGIADANGDFTVSFGSASYTSGEKITVTAEKDSATKSIELYAPSEVVGGGVIQFTGSLNDFPNNIGAVELHLSGSIGAYAFASNNVGAVWQKATGLIIKSGVTSIESNAFASWVNALSLVIPDSCVSIKNSAFRSWRSALSLVIPSSVVELETYAFEGWSAALSFTLSSNITAIPANCFQSWLAITNIDIPEGVLQIGSQSFAGATACLSLLLPSTLLSCTNNSFQGLTSCNEITCFATTPPTITSTTFSGLKSTCIIKVPTGSVEAYKAAPNWSTFAARIQAI